MKRIYYALILASFLFPATISAQNLDKLQNFGKQPVLNSSGDPVSNIIDPNGARQGHWYYILGDSSVFFEADFTDNVLTTFQIQGDNYAFGSTESEFIDAGQTGFSASLISDLSQAGLDLSDKGFFLVVGQQSDSVVFYGEWTAAATQSALDIIHTKDLKPLLQLTNYDYAILDF